MAKLLKLKRFIWMFLGVKLINIDIKGNFTASVRGSSRKQCLLFVILNNNVRTEWWLHGSKSWTFLLFTQTFLAFSQKVWRNCFWYEDRYESQNFFMQKKRFNNIHLHLWTFIDTKQWIGTHLFIPHSIELSNY